MRVNIYIRKDNEDRWDALADKSAWVNDLLSKTAPRAQEPDHQPESLIEQATAIFEGKTCKNGHPSSDGKRCSKMKCVYS